VGGLVVGRRQLHTLPGELGVEVASVRIVHHLNRKQTDLIN
jgi:hypothetical protein